MNAEGKAPNRVASSSKRRTSEAYQSSARRVAARASGRPARIWSRVSAARGAAMPPGHHPGRVDALAADRLDHLLAEAAQPDPVAGQLRVGPQHPEQVPAVRLGVEAEQQIGRGQVEEAEGVGLHHLGQVQDPAQVGAGRGRLDGQDLVAGLGRGDQVADRADAADAGHDRRQLVHGPALADALEAAELGDVEVGVGDLAVARRAGW